MNGPIALDYLNKLIEALRQWGCDHVKDTPVFYYRYMSKVRNCVQKWM